MRARFCCLGLPPLLLLLLLLLIMMMVQSSPALAAGPSFFGLFSPSPFPAAAASGGVNAWVRSLAPAPAAAEPARTAESSAVPVSDAPTTAPPQEASGAAEAAPVAPAGSDAHSTRPVLVPPPPPPSATAHAEGQPSPSRHPGSGIHLALGFAGGGDQLLEVTFTNGQMRNLDAGDGVYGSIGGTITPFWLGDKVGLGAGANIGWKAASVNASNGKLGISRFPLVCWLQMLPRLSSRWYAAILGGIHKELKVRVEGSGLAEALDADFESPLGWMTELGLYYADSPRGAIGFGLRYTWVDYVFRGERIDADNIGAGLTLHFNP